MINSFLQCAIHKLNFLGLFHLFKLFLRYCYDPEDPNQDLFSHKYVPKPNDFSDLAEYFVRKVFFSLPTRRLRSFLINFSLDFSQCHFPGSL